MLARGWQFFNENLGNGYQELTKEFYANLRANSIEDKFHFSSFLRGVTIPLSGHILNKLLKVPILDEEGCHYTWKVDIFHRAENENLRKEILEECCEQRAIYITKMNGAPKSVRKNCLNHLPLLWCHYVLLSLQPVAHATEIDIKRLNYEELTKVKPEKIMDKYWVIDHIDHFMPQESKRPKQPKPTSFAPPSPTRAGTSFDLSMIATALNMDHTEEIGVPPDRDLWLAFIGFTIPPDDTPLATEFPPHPKQDNDEPMDEESEEEDD
ncbi:hypothetical protein RJT34_01713 [Clitoria ternatea]|uniref:Putative plant transposon protein domain-containing protein n=1 Tax=Clitoria ternatea TaxID=43366 RepID=A0AAN9KJN7_CLITE